MTQKKFELFKIILTFFLAGIIGPFISYMFTQMDKDNKEIHASRERALTMHDELIGAASQRVFWTRRYLSELRDSQKNALTSSSKLEYDQAISDWSSLVSTHLRSFQNDYPPRIWENFKSLNAALGELNADTRIQANYIRKGEIAGNINSLLKKSAKLSNDIFDLSYDIQNFVQSEEFEKK